MPDWGATVEDLGPRLLRYFCASFRRELASELVQEVLIRLVRKHRGGMFDETRGSLRMLAFGIARFVRLEALKEMNPAEVQPADGILPEQAGEPEDLERRIELRRLISGPLLSEVERDVILLFLDRDFSLAEIGQILQIPTGTVKSHLSRAKATLRAVLDTRLGDSNA